MQERALPVDEEGCVVKISEVSDSPQVPLGRSSSCAVQIGSTRR